MNFDHRMHSKSTLDTTQNNLTDEITENIVSPQIEIGPNLPPINNDDSIDLPKQANIDDSELVIATLPKHSKLSSFVVLLIIGLIGISGGTYALFFNSNSKKSPEVFELAPQGKLTCMPIDDQGNITNEKYRYNRMKVINLTGENRQVWVQWNQCSPNEIIHNSDGTIECRKYAKREPYIVGPGGENAQIFTIDVACESTGQLDIGSDDSKSPCFNSVDNGDWQGGVAFTIKTNSQSCVLPTATPTTTPTPSPSLTATPSPSPTPTTTPTPTPTASPTPTPSATAIPMSCLNLYTSKFNPQRGDTIIFSCNGIGSYANFARFQLFNINLNQSSRIISDLIPLDNNKKAAWTYTIRENAEAGVYKVQCQICQKSLGFTECTNWGLAE